VVRRPRQLLGPGQLSDLGRAVAGGQVEPHRRRRGATLEAGELPVNGMRRMLGLAIALAAVVMIIILGTWLVLLRVSEPARARLASYAERQQLGPGQLLLLSLVAVVAIVLLALTKRS
jgi:hypothetical protein